ncbi:MAG TPA: hypothetical protein VG389_26850 [Myxococcota bacterium]|jgi:hypothetical protein|nr:hypothetical protein [Myxococcota bacterium]
MTRNTILGLSVLGAAVVAAVGIALFGPGSGRGGAGGDGGPALPVQGVDDAIAGRVAAVRAARLKDFAPGAAEEPVGAALRAYNAREAEVVRVAAAAPEGLPAGKTLADLVDADPEVARLSRALEAAVGAYVRAAGPARLMAQGTWLAARFDESLAALLADGVPGGSDAAARLAGTEAAAPYGDVLGGFPVLFLERGLLRAGSKLDATMRTYASALWLWRFAGLAGATAPEELLDPVEQLCFWRALVEVERPGEPAGRLPRRLAALVEVARLDPTYPATLTRGVLLLRAGDPAGARAAFSEAATATPADLRAAEYLRLADAALATAAPAPGGAPATASATASGTAAP